MITAQEYRDFVGFMMNKDDRKMPLEFACLGLAGEYGEVDSAFQGVILNPPSTEAEVSAADDAILKELGDLLWYKTAVSISLFGPEVQEVLLRGAVKSALQHLVCAVCDDVKKHLWHGKELDAEGTRRLLAGIDHKIARCAEDMGYSYEEVMQRNVDKIRARYPAGFVEGGGVR